MRKLAGEAASSFPLSLLGFFKMPRAGALSADEAGEATVPLRIAASVEDAGDTASD